MTRGHDRAEPRPLDEWEGAEVERLRSEWGIAALRVLGSTTSTSDVARRLAEAGAPHGTTVIAEHQTAGRGRYGRGWFDRQGGSLLLSVVLRPSGDPAAETEPSVLPLLAGLACARGIRAATGVEVGIEWPNDLVVDDLKLGGILCEAVVRGGAIDFAVVGVGINVDAVPDALDAQLRAVSTALAALAARQGRDAPSRRGLAAAVVPRLAALRADSRFSERDLDELRALDALAGRPVRLGTGLEGHAAGILPDGSLAIDDRGESVRVTAGSVTPIGPRAR